MKIKKFTPLAVLTIALLMAIPSLAQGPFVHLNVGYGLPLAGQSLTSWDHEITSSSDNTTYKTVGYSVGYGLNYTLGGGYMFNQMLGAGLDLNILSASSPVANVGKTVRDSGSINASSTLKWTVFQFRIIPNIILSLPLNEKMNIYTRLGLVIAPSTRIDLTGTQDTSSAAIGHHEVVVTQRYSGNTALGFFGALGYGYNFNKKLSLFGELTMIAMNYSPAKSVYTVLTQDGTDLLPLYKTREKEIDYQNNPTVSNSKIADENSPTVEFSKSYPFGSFGLNIGVRYKF